MKFVQVLSVLCFLKASSQTVQAQPIPIQQGYADIGRYTIYEAHPLSVGEVIPQSEFAIDNFYKPTVSLNEFSNKLLILDFWETTCTSCIGSFPHMQDLQMKFGDKIQIILVDAAQKKEYVDSFFMKNTWVKRPNLPMITGDTILFKYFPHNTLPHHVWIYHDSVYSIHETNHTSENTIRTFLNTGKASFPQKYDYALQNDSLSNIIKIHERQQDINYYSILTGERNAGAFFGLDKIESTSTDAKYPNRIALVDQDFIVLACTAFGERFNKQEKYNFLRGHNGISNNIIYELKNDSSYIPDRHDPKYYCYYAEVPEDQASHIFEYMREDIKRYFPNIECKIEQRVVNCWVLSGSPNRNLVSKEKRDCKTCDNVSEFNNAPFSVLTNYISYFIDGKHLLPPFVDATNWHGNIDLKFEHWDNLEMLQNYLKRYGLSLEERPWKTDILVIHQK